MKRISIIAFFICFLNHTSYSANRYWVGLISGNWNSAANWSASSAGSGGSSVPGVSDIAIFDGGASANGDCSLDATVNVSGIQINGYTGTITQAGLTIIIGTSGYSQSTGTFIGNAASISITNGNFSLSGGAFSSTSGSLNLNGTGASANIFTHSAGTFNHNSGTINFNRHNGCSSGTYTVDIINSTSFYNVTLNLPTSCSSFNHILTTAVGDTIDVINDFTHTDGKFLGIGELKNNLIIGAGSDGGTGVIILNGTSAQTYSVAAGSTRTCWLKINKSSGTTTPAVGTTALSVQGFEQLIGDFTAPSGNFNIGASQNSATIFNHIAGTFTHNNGTIIFDASNGCSAGSYTIDILNSTSFYNITVSLPTICSVNFNLTTAAGDTIDVTNNFTHTDGNFNGLAEVKNNLIIGVGSDGGSGFIIMNGTGAQTYSVAVGATRTCWLKIDKTTGSVTPAVGTSVLSIQGYHQLIGDFTAPTGNFNIGGLSVSSLNFFTHTAGTFNNNSGTVILDASNGCSPSTYTVDVLNTTSFYNLTIALPLVCGLNSNLTIAAGDTIDVDNNLTLTDGKTINNFIECQGNIIISSTFDASNTTQLIINGQNNTSLDATGATALFDGKVIINKTLAANTVTFLSNWDLDAVSQTITFNKGRFISSATNYLNIGDNVTVANVSDSSYVDGPVRKTGNDTFIFPIGKSGYFHPVSIAAPGNSTDNFKAEYFPSDPHPTYSTSSKDLSLHHLSRCEYWMVNRTSGTSNVAVGLSWNTNSCGVTNLTDLRVAQWNGTMWKDFSNGGSSGNTTSGTVVSSGAVTNFGAFTLGSPSGSNPLPVELISFDAKFNGSLVDISWITASEINSDYFTVEKSADGVIFKTVIVIPAAGSSNATLKYKTADKNPLAGNSYYRLKQTDFNGDVKYSDIININRTGNFNCSIFPNPANGAQTYLNVSGQAGLDVVIRLCDMTGKIFLYRHEQFKTSQNIVIPINHSQKLTPGIYMIIITSGQKVYEQRIIING